MLKEMSFPQVYLVCGYTDMQRSIDGLAAIVKQHFSLEPCSGSLFLFYGRRRDRLKALGLVERIFAADKGADASTRCYSIIESAKLNKLNVFGYLTHLLTELPKLENEPTLEQLDALMPWLGSLPEYCK